MFWIYAGFAAVGIVFVKFCIPETKGHSLEDIDEYWTQGKQWPDHTGNGNANGSPSREQERASVAR